MASEEEYEEEIEEEVRYRFDTLQSIFYLFRSRPLIQSKNDNNAALNYFA